MEKFCGIKRKSCNQESFLYSLLNIDVYAFAKCQLDLNAQKFDIENLDSLIYDYFKSKNMEMVLSVMLPSCGMRTGGDTFTEKDIQRYLNLDNEKGKFL